MVTDVVMFEGENNYGFDRTINLKKTKLKIVEGNGFEGNRKTLQNKKVDILLSPEKGIKKDSMHHRNSGLNHVLCKLAKENNIVIAISFSDILNSKNRSDVIARIMQNVKLCKKYKVKIMFGSFAKNKWELRGYEDLKDFAKILGMDDKMAKEAFNVIEEILNKNNEIRRGVKLVNEA
ncbi:hypothetical protein D6777_03485 [Candidatus Woesearchaeota archaeon]|nr:MAG: hypothetical protein D6777_03485 [Candidatus Woesearchaeota archaeon]